MNTKNSCEKCGGTGQKINADWLKSRRLAKGMLAKFVADRMGITDSYFCDLEQGRRDWNADLLARFEKALKV